MSRPFSLLLIEDDEIDAAIIQQAVLRDRVQNPERPFSVVHAARLSDGLEHLAGQGFDAVLLDMSLPDATEFTGVTKLKEQHPDLPVMVTTGNCSADVGVHAIHAGADDFIVKSDQPEGLIHRLRLMIARAGTQPPKNACAEESTSVFEEYEINAGDAARLASGISHDLRAPIRHAKHLINWIHLSIDEKNPEKTRADLVRLNDRIEQADLMLQALTKFIRIGLRDAPIAAVRVCLLIDDVVNSIEHPSTMSFSVDADDNEVRTQVDDLKTVLRTVIANSVIHHDSPAGHIRIQMTQLAGALDFAISDDGPGIAEVLRKNVFGLFIRGKSSRLSAGAGLAIAHKLVTRRGGRIHVSDNTPRGTLVTIRWPLVE